MAGNIRWYFDTLTPGIAALNMQVEHQLEDELLEAAIEMVEKMKANAPWEDQTGQAREELDAEVFKEPNVMGIYLFHGVDYGIWLEVRWGGQYAIILPTMETEGPALMRRLEGLLDRAT